MGVNPSHLYLSSYDSTQAGLELGRAALGSDIRIMGFAPGVWSTKPVDLITRYANQAAERLDLSCRFNVKDIYNTTDYVGKSYGIPTSTGIKMIKLMARTEGVFLDPVYTSKAMSGLYDHIQRGELTSEDIVIFLHTGGNPALFAYQEELDMEELKNHLDYD
ncbi:L-cysteate sulfo-lyase [subsurface metagenome]